ncbi:MAG: HPF/RaiA family ribosome-associated protein [Bdellovibrionia bacterium]
MFATISSEDFEITGAIRDHVDKIVEELFHVVPYTKDDLAVHFYLHRESERLYSSTIRARLWGKDFVAAHRSPNLYQAVNLAKRHLVRQLNHVRGRRTAMKRRPNVEKNPEAPWPM